MRLQFDFFCSFHTPREKRFKSISIQKHLKKVMQAKSLYEIASEASYLVQFQIELYPSLAGQFYPSWSGHIAKITNLPALSGLVATITVLPLIIGTSNQNHVFTPHYRNMKLSLHFDTFNPHYWDIYLKIMNACRDWKKCPDKEG